MRDGHTGEHIGVKLKRAENRTTAGQEVNVLSLAASKSSAEYLKQQGFKTC